MAKANITKQVAPAANTETDLYTVPALTKAVVSSIVMCNRGILQVQIRISIAVGGGATATKDYLLYDVVFPPNDTYIATIGMTLNAADVVRVYSSTANTSYSLFGEEQS
jgi:hypothetical protein